MRQRHLWSHAGQEIQLQMRTRRQVVLSAGHCFSTSKLPVGAEPFEVCTLRFSISRNKTGSEYMLPGGRVSGCAGGSQFCMRTHPLRAARLTARNSRAVARFRIANVSHRPTSSRDSFSQVRVASLIRWRFFVKGRFLGSGPCARNQKLLVAVLERQGRVVGSSTHHLGCTVVFATSISAQSARAGREPRGHELDRRHGVDDIAFVKSLTAESHADI